MPLFIIHQTAQQIKTSENQLFKNAASRHLKRHQSNLFIFSSRTDCHCSIAKLMPALANQTILNTALNSMELLKTVIKKVKYNTRPTA